MQSRCLELELERRVLTNTTGESGLETKRLRVRHIVEAKILLPRFTKLHFKTSVFEHVWPPHNLSKFFFKSFEIVCNLEVVHLKPI